VGEGVEVERAFPVRSMPSIGKVRDLEREDEPSGSEGEH